MSVDKKEPVLKNGSIGLLIEEIEAEYDRLVNGPSSEILATRDCWNLRDEPAGVYSTESMSDEELQQAAIEDMINVIHFRLKGHDLGGTVEQYTRFLSGRSLDRALEAFDSPIVKSLTVKSNDGKIEIHPDHIQDAMDFAGVWLAGWEPLTEGPVYSAQRNFQ